MSLRNKYYIALEGLRIFKGSIHKKIKGRKKYEGNAEEVCKQIITDCYNVENNYFMVSPGHFNQFYMRDFAMVCEALLNLGYEEEVKNTLVYVLERYSEADEITTQITPKGVPVNFPYYTPESLAYLVRCLKLLNDVNLLEKYKFFIIRKTEELVNNELDVSGLLRQDKYYSSMKDHSKRKSSCYNNCLVAMLKKDLQELGWNNALNGINIKKAIAKSFWNTSYFYEDLTKEKMITGDANVFAFWSGVFEDENMFEKAMLCMKEARLDFPFALRYRNDKKGNFNFADVLVNGYEKDTVWIHLGVCYLQTLYKFDKSVELKKHLISYTKKINEHQNFLEVYTAQGKPFSSLFYECEGSMIWCASYLDLIRKTKFVS